MNMNKVFACFAVYLFKIKAAYLAGSAVMFNTFSSCFWVSFIGVDCDTFDRAFEYLILGLFNFFGKSKFR